MNKKIGIISIMIFLLPLQLTFAEEFDFRKTKWGMNKEEIKKSESKNNFIKQEKNYILYKGELSNFNVTVAYIFALNKLIRTAYIIEKKHTNNNDYIDDFLALKNSLEKKYGKPITDEKYWKNDLYKERPQDWGSAISQGHLKYFSKWETEQTEINMVLEGDNYQIIQKIQYRSKLLYKLEENESEKKILDDL